MTDEKSAQLKFILKQDRTFLFFPLLQQGVQVKAKVGCSIQSLLCDQFGLMPDYLSDRINTIFLNGKPVDEVKTAIVNEGATLALSAAMPGLVGATFRKAGCLASFRGTITHKSDENETGTCHEGSITLKLFNLLLKEMGPLILERGFWVSGLALFDLLQTHQGDEGAIFKRVEKDGLSLEQIGDPIWVVPEARYFIQVSCEP